MSFQTDKYEIDFFNVKNADAILIRCFNGMIPYIILIDAGNTNDSEIIKNHLKDYYDNSTIDLAICTHPDKDHIGGFFNLLNDDNISISEFWLIDPAAHLSADDLKYYRNEESAREAVRKVFNHPNDPQQNLIEILTSKNGIKALTIKEGCSHEEIPIKVLAPTTEYYSEIVKDMVEGYVEPYDEPDTEAYDENALPDDDDAKSVIDEVDDDSPFNAGSIVLLFEPGDGNQFLFTGDANCASLSQMIEKHDDELNNIEILKVPHHGSKHNITTEIIEKLKPKYSIISAKGTKKHPNSGLVHWLSKYGDVYSTHKTTKLRYHKNINRPNTSAAIPLRKKSN